MRIPKLFSLIVTLIIFISFGGIALATDVPMKNMESACLLAKRCDLTQAGECEPSNNQPLIRVHRTLLEVESSLSSNQVFVLECLEGSPLCYPLPIVADGIGWKLKNYKADRVVGHPIAEDTASWEFHRQAFIDAMIQMCLAAYVNPADGVSACTQASIESQDGFSELAGVMTANNYQYHGLYEAGTLVPVVTPYPVIANQGKRFESASYSSEDLERSFKIVAFTNPIEGTSGGAPSDKVGKLGFVRNAEACPTTSSHDPFGQVFDRGTMQPVKDAKVVLYREMDNGQNLLPPVLVYDRVTTTNTEGLMTPFVNPRRSNDLGVFSFVVPAGNYKLLVLPNSANAPERLPTVLASSSVMDTRASDMNPGVSVVVGGTPTVLYPEVYQVTTSGVNLDLPVIVENDVPERRDISVVGLIPRQASVLPVPHRVVNSAGDNIITGRINKPFGMVRAKNTPQNGGQELGSTSADIDGKFTLVISTNVLPRGRHYELEATAVPLIPTPPLGARINEWVQKLLEKLLPQVHAQSMSSTTVITTRLNYIEGYAYDESGNILKNARVTVFDSTVGVPVYTTQTDQSGFYKVSSENLPRNDYSIRYTPEGSNAMVKVDLEKFYTQNKEYIEKSKIDVLKPKYGQSAQAYLTQNPEPSVTTEQGTKVGPKQGTPGELNKGVAPTRAVEQNNPVNQLSPALLMYVAILLLLIVGAGLLIVYYMKRRQEPHLYE